MKRQLRFAAGFVVALMAILLFSACTRPLLDETQMADPIDLAEPLPTVVPGALLTPTASTEELVESAYPAPGEEVSAGEEAATSAAAADGQAAEAAEGQGQVLHVVQPGDTLGHLAQQYDISIDEIIAANSISNPDVLEVGQQIVIPAAGTVQVQSTAPVAGTPAAPSEQLYTVQPGDTLFSIGQRYGFTVEQLAAYNGIANPNQLEVGQQLRIPPQQ